MCKHYQQEAAATKVPAAAATKDPAAAATKVPAAAATKVPAAAATKDPEAAATKDPAAAATKDPAAEDPIPKMQRTCQPMHILQGCRFFLSGYFAVTSSIVLKHFPPANL